MSTRQHVSTNIVATVIDLTMSSTYIFYRFFFCHQFAKAWPTSWRKATPERLGVTA
jgi:hypothetical protein